MKVGCGLNMKSPQGAPKIQMNCAIQFWSKQLVCYVTGTVTAMRRRDNGGSSRLEHKVISDSNTDSDSFGT